jgi:endonuclease YncB( thermonuclease family)
VGINRPFKAVPIQLGKRYRAKRRRERVIRFAGPAMLLLIAAGVGGTFGTVSTVGTTAARPLAENVVTSCTVTDGDTVNCNGERIRLLGIDAPELPGHCREGRDCAPGDPYASTSSLSRALTGVLRITRVGEDHYGRTLAAMTGDQGDLSCWQLEHGQAIYKRQWDDGQRIAGTCPASAR